MHINISINSIGKWKPLKTYGKTNKYNEYTNPIEIRYSYAFEEERQKLCPGSIVTATEIILLLVLYLRLCVCVLVYWHVRVFMRLDGAQIFTADAITVDHIC